MGRKGPSSAIVPELRFANSGIAVTDVQVAVSQRSQQDGGWRDSDTGFQRINVWRGQAERLADSLGKGDRVMVTGPARQHMADNRAVEANTELAVAFIFYREVRAGAHLAEAKQPLATMLPSD